MRPGEAQASTLGRMDETTVADDTATDAPVDNDLVDAPVDDRNDDELVDELLVEEISIDGMCGVY